MSENLTGAKCSQRDWELARDSGLPIFSTSDELAIHAFASAIRAQEPEAIVAFRSAINAKLKAAYLLVGRHDLTDLPKFKEEAEKLFSEVREAISDFQRRFA